MTDMKHMDHLEAVAAFDVATLRRKESTYQGSWKRRGGVGAFMMMARKWDRLEQILRTHEKEYDVFSCVQTQDNADDGSALAELRDLRQYLLLVEAELQSRGGSYQFIKGVEVRQHQDKEWLNQTVEFQVRAMVSDCNVMKVLRGRVYGDSGASIAIMVGNEQWTQRKADCVCVDPKVGSMVGITVGWMDDDTIFQGTVLEDDGESYLIQPDHATAEPRSHRRINQIKCRVVEVQRLIPRMSTEADLYAPIAQKLSIPRSVVKQICIARAWSGVAGESVTDFARRVSGLHSGTLNGKYENIVAVLGEMDDGMMSEIRLRRSKVEQPRLSVWSVVDQRALRRDGQGAWHPKPLISSTLYHQISPEARKLFVLVGANAIEDRSTWTTDQLEVSHRFDQSMTKTALAGLPSWIHELYEPRAGVELEVQLKAQFRKFWGK